MIPPARSWPGVAPDDRPRSLRQSSRRRREAAEERSAMGRPSITCRKASYNSTSPAPPASTTPAWASTGNRSGVRQSEETAACLAASNTSKRSPPPRSSTFRAAAAASAATVSIVPSTGRMTPARAAALPSASATAASCAPTTRQGANVPEMPRRIWQRMTPELPRAPMSDPLAMARQAAPMASPSAAERSRPSSALTTLSTVRAMFVPVSPSGTG